MRKQAWMNFRPQDQQRWREARATILYFEWTDAVFHSGDDLRFYDTWSR